MVVLGMMVSWKNGLQRNSSWRYTLACYAESCRTGSGWQSLHCNTHPVDWRRLRFRYTSVMQQWWEFWQNRQLRTAQPVLFHRRWYWWRTASMKTTCICGHWKSRKFEKISILEAWLQTIWRTFSATFVRYHDRRWSLRRSNRAGSVAGCDEPWG